MTSDPRWALDAVIGPGRTGAGTPLRVEPPLSVRNGGFAPDEAVPAQLLNYLLGVQGDILSTLQASSGWFPDFAVTVPFGGSNIVAADWTRGDNPALVVLTNDDGGGSPSQAGIAVSTNPILGAPSSGFADYSTVPSSAYLISQWDDQILVQSTGATSYTTNGFRPSAVGGTSFGSWNSVFCPFLLSQMAYSPSLNMTLGASLGSSAYVHTSDITTGWTTSNTPIAGGAIVWSDKWQRFVAASTTTSPQFIATSIDGLSWTDFSGTSPGGGPISSTVFRNVLTERSTDGVFYYLTASGLWKSEDGAETWTNILSSAGSVWASIEDAVSFPRQVFVDDDSIYIQCLHGMVRSTNETTWAPFFAPEMTVAQNVQSFEFRPGFRNVLYQRDQDNPRLYVSGTRTPLRLISP